MPEATFNVPAGKKMGRSMLISHLNTGTKDNPIWTPIGKGVSSSDISYDWKKESNTDILDNVETEMHKPVITQPFDPWPLRGGDAAQEKLWNLAVKDQDAAALTDLDCLIVHSNVGSPEEGYFAERYTSCAFDMSRMGGDGGGFLTSGFEVTYGGTRTIGKAKSEAGVITFTEDK